LTLDQLNAFGSRNANAVSRKMDPEDLDKALHAGKQFRRSMARGGTSPDVTLDIVMQAIEPKGEGNDASGYRENLLIPGGKKMTMFLVKEQGKYKVLDTTENPNSIGLEVIDRIDANHLDDARVLLDWLREDEHLEGGDDPLSGQSFPRFWTKGKDADAAQMKLAAAAILVQTKATAAQGVALLEAARKTATAEPARTNILLALLEGYGIQQDYASELPLAAGIFQQYPESKRAFFTNTFCLRALGRFEEAEDLARKRLKKMPDDTDALRALAYNASAREDYRAAHDWNQKIVDTGKAEAQDLNGLAWETLFYGRDGGPDIETAIRATQMSQNAPNILHTLACLYAEAGKTKEAREVLIQARPKQAIQIPDSTYRLAQNRLKVLQGHS
jgi:tetratricopeptide (TPR) repeat protein